MSANEAEKEYRWLDAAKGYKELLSSHPGSSEFTGESWQKIGLCYSLASNQAKDLKEFKKLEISSFGPCTSEQVEIQPATVLFLFSLTEIIGVKYTRTYLQ